MKKGILLFICFLYFNVLFGQNLTTTPIFWSINCIANKKPLAEVEKSLPKVYTYISESKEKDGSKTKVYEKSINGNTYSLKLSGDKLGFLISISFENPISVFPSYFGEFDSQGYNLKGFANNIGVYECANSNIKIWCRETEKMVWVMIFKN